MKKDGSFKDCKVHCIIINKDYFEDAIRGFKAEGSSEQIIPEAMKKGRLWRYKLDVQMLNDLTISLKAL